MILWTIQYEPFMKKLEQRTRLRARWREAEACWKGAYLWMARQMVKRGHCSRPVAPIWAWPPPRHFGEGAGLHSPTASA